MAREGRTGSGGEGRSHVKKVGGRGSYGRKKGRMGGKEGAWDEK